MIERFFLFCTGIRNEVAGRREGWTGGPCLHPSLFWNCALPGMLSWEFSIVSFSKTSETFSAPVIPESWRGACCKNTFGVSNFRIWPKLPQIETTFSLLYRTLLICIIDSSESKTWITGFSQLFPICKPYLTDANLVGCLFSHF